MCYGLRPGPRLTFQGIRRLSLVEVEDDSIWVLHEPAAKLSGSPDHKFIRVRHDVLGAPPVYEYVTAKRIERMSSRSHSDGSHGRIFVHQ